MVCERQPDSPNDPAVGRIELVVDGEWLTANGTTLGADDGVAIAAMMALVEDESLPHGPLQLLMTVAEEVGLEGANGLDGSLVDGKVLVNLDSEEDGRLTVGCAGSTDTWIRISRPREPLSGGSVLADGDRERRPRRPLRHEHPPRTLERRQGARASAARGVRDRSVPARLARRRQEPQRDPARRSRGRLGGGRRRSRSPPRDRVGGGDDPRRLREDGRGRDSSPSTPRTARTTRGRRQAPRRCSTLSRSSRPARSR